MTSHKPKSFKVLVVEDEASYRALLQSVLRKAGHQCAACINGDQAIEKLKKESFDLLIIDYLLPGPSALDVLRWARSQSIMTPAYVITAYPSEQLKHECTKLGDVELHTKPEFEAAKLGNLIEQRLK